LQNEHRKDKEEGLNGITESAVWKEKPQSGTQDNLWPLRKYCSNLQKEKFLLTQESSALRRERDELKADFDELKSKYSALTDNLIDQKGRVKVMMEVQSSIQKARLILTQEADTLRSEREVLKVEFDELKQECSALKENLNAITEEYDTLQRDKDNLVCPEGRVKMMLEELSNIQEAQLILTQERDTLRSEHKEFKVNFEELMRDCSALKVNFNVIREKCDDLQRNKDALLGLEAIVKMMLDEESSIQNPHILLTQERDALRSEYEELKVSFYEPKRECSLLKDLNAVREERDGPEKDKDKLVHLENRMKMMLDELSSIQKAHFVVTQERDTLRSEHNELKVDFAELKRECSALKEKLNAITEDRDTLQRQKEKLVGLEGRTKTMLDD
jgi:chromosome segregation ATPase